MILYIIRHAWPDYATDSLRKDGIKQAKLLSKRLIKSGIDEIYSSPMGRAIQTALPTAKKLKLNINIEEWAYELGDDCKTKNYDDTDKILGGIPNNLYVNKYNGNDDFFENCNYLKDNKIHDRYVSVSNGIDNLLSRCGYQRNENSKLYSPVSPNDKHIALFCHAGMQRILISHILNMPYNETIGTYMAHFTGITTIFFDNMKNDEVAPRLLSFGDIGHLYNGREKIVHYFAKERF